MISIFEAIDSFLLEKVFQNFSDFFQMATGMTCFFLAKIAIILSFVSWVIHMISDPGDNPYLLFFFSLFTLYLAYNAWQLTVIADVAEWQMNEGRRMKNPAALALFPPRFLSLLIFPLSLIGALSLRGHGWASDQRLLYLNVFVMFGVIWIYFFSCTPLPPGEKKAKQWLEGPTTVAAPAE